MKRNKMLGAMVFLALVSLAQAADPTEISAVGAMGEGYVTTAKAVALGFAIIGMGVAGYRVIRKYVR